jgi:hypothetical protein
MVVQSKSDLLASYVPASEDAGWDRGELCEPVEEG